MKSKRSFLLILVICLLAVALWFYWEQSFSLASVLPEEQWIRAEIWVGDPGIGDTKWEGEIDLNALLMEMEQTHVTRGPDFPGMTQPYFRLTLYKGEAYPTIICVVKNGQISVAKELDFDHYKYYEGGEELYIALQKMIVAES